VENRVSSEDGRNYRSKQVELIEIINKTLLLHVVGYLYYWQMGFNSVFKGLTLLRSSRLQRWLFKSYSDEFHVKKDSGKKTSSLSEKRLLRKLFRPKGGREN
jgi:hypothetical protein